MTPNPGPVVEPELKEVNKVETKPISNTESETKPSDVGSDVVAQIKFKFTVDKCPYETDELKPPLAAKLLGIPSEANHVVCVAPSGPPNKLQIWDSLPGPTPQMRTCNKTISCSVQNFH